MADRLLEAAPRDEAKIIEAALRSGLFLRDAPSTRAALVRRMECPPARGAGETARHGRGPQSTGRL